jgi:hypothetical protein
MGPIEPKSINALHKRKWSNIQRKGKAMTFKILALIISLIGMAVTLSGPSRPSDAYQVGYAEGRFDLYTESRAIKKFNECVAAKEKKPEACWQAQIEWTKVLYRSWDAMTDQQKIDHVAQSSLAQSTGIKWADILRGKGDGKVTPPLPVEIK